MQPPLLPLARTRGQANLVCTMRLVVHQAEVSADAAAVAWLQVGAAGSGVQ
jgi:hypothetical protein